MTQSPAREYIEAIRARLRATPPAPSTPVPLDLLGVSPAPFRPDWAAAWRSTPTRLDIGVTRALLDDPAKVSFGGTARLPAVPATLPPPEGGHVEPPACVIDGQLSLEGEQLRAILTFAPVDQTRGLRSLFPRLPACSIADDDEADATGEEDAWLLARDVVRSIRLTFSTHQEDAAALGKGLNLAFEWTSDPSRFSWVPSVPRTVRGAVIMPEEVPEPLLEGELPLDRARAPGVHLACALGAEAAVTEGVSFAAPELRLYSPLTDEPEWPSRGYRPLIACAGEVRLDRVKPRLRARGVIAARSWQDFAEEVWLRCSFEGDQRIGASSLFGRSAEAQTRFPPGADASTPVARLGGASIGLSRAGGPWTVVAARLEFGIDALSWTPVPGLSASLDRLSLGVSSPGTDEMEISARLDGALRAFGLDLDVAVEVVDVERRALRLRAVQRGELAVPLADVFRWLPAGGLPELYGPLHVKGLTLDLSNVMPGGPGNEAPWEHRFSMQVVAMPPAHGERAVALSEMELSLSSGGWSFKAVAPGGWDIGEALASLGSMIRPAGGEKVLPAATEVPQAVGGFRVLDLAVRVRRDGTVGFSASGVLEFRGKEAAAVLEIDAGAEETRFSGCLSVDGMTFELDFSRDPSGSIAAGTWQGRRGQPLQLAGPMSVVPRSALLVHQPSPPLWLIGGEAGIRISHIELPGLSLGDGSLSEEETLGLDLRVLVPSRDLPAGEAARINTLVPGLALPEDLAGARIVPTLVIGGQRVGATFEPSLAVPTAPGAAGATPPRPPPAPRSNAGWVQIQRSFGPIHVERVGCAAEGDEVALLLDASMSAAGLTIALDGLAVRLPLQTLQPTFSLRGLGLDYRNEAVEIGGSFLANQGSNGFSGAAVIKTPAFTVEGMGSYETREGQPSLFLYASLDSPLGGPPCCFVTGLTAAFGYNRRLILPPMEALASFALIAEKPPTTYLEALTQLQAFVPPEIGSVFVGLGGKLTSFRIVESSVLATASAGDGLALDLIGRSTLTWPQPPAPGVPPLVSVKVGWRASLSVPGDEREDGVLALRAQLDPSSYVFSPDCHVSGGFAFSAWLSGKHQGDFVLTLGGYHPSFTPEAHYPVVPRLRLSWRASRELSVKGEAYFALTPTAMMAGGHLEALWEDGAFRVWFKAAIDCSFSWKPIRYEVEVFVELGVSYTFDFFGTQHITASAGARLEIWGPPFAMLAHVDLTVVSFDVSFGERTEKLEAIGAGEFEASFLPPRPCGISLRAGLVATDGAAWVVNPGELRLVVDSAVPSHSIRMGAASPGEPRRGFGIPPMEASPEDVVDSTTVIEILDAAGNDVTGRFQASRVTKKFPVALWGAGGTSGNRLVEAFGGAEITIRPPMAALAVPVTRSYTTILRRKVTLPWINAALPSEAPANAVGVRIAPDRRLGFPAGKYTVKATQTLTVKAWPEDRPSEPEDEPGPKVLVTRKYVDARELRVPGPSEDVSLPLAAVHSVFPPRGDLGDHSGTLPHIVLDRSTLPWDQSPDGWPALALLVFHEGEISAEDPPASGGLIRVDPALLAAIAPTGPELGLLTHVRIAAGEQARAVIVANRLPRKGTRNTVHLVSMAGRHRPGGLPSDGTFRSLHSWSFSCFEGQAGFASLAGALQAGPVEAGSTGPANALEAGFASLSDALQAGSLETEVLRAAGWVNLPHGGGVSAYHGPFVSELVEGTSIALSAARELGRLMTLGNKPIAVELFRWKRRRAHDRRVRREVAANPKLHPKARRPPAGEEQMPGEIAGWVAKLERLEGIPLQYLVPDEQLLPKSALRFFQVDPEWVHALVAGALSVGSVWREDDVSGTRAPRRAPLSGVLLRSELVSGWPDLRLIARDEAGEALPEFAEPRRLSPSILLVLFDGLLAEVELRDAGDTLHFAPDSAGVRSIAVGGAPVEVLDVAATGAATSRDLAERWLARPQRAGFFGVPFLPAAPTGVKVKLTDPVVTVRWANPDRRVTGHELEIARSGDPFEAPTLVRLSRTSADLTGGGLQRGGLFHVRVRARAERGSVGPWSTSVPFALKVLEAPRGLLVVTDAGQVIASWQGAAADGVTGYVVEVNGVARAPVQGTNSVLDGPEVVAGAVLRVRVKVAAPFSFGTFCPPVGLRIVFLAKPAPPALRYAEETLVASWVADPAAEGYQVDVLDVPALSLEVKHAKDSATLTGSAIVPGARLRVRVRAMAQAARSAWSDPSSLVIPAVYSFTNAGKTGRQGPSQEMVDSAYRGTILQGSVTVTPTGIQRWVVPANGRYRITARGAQGGHVDPRHGLGAMAQGDFLLFVGQVLWILVGQEGHFDIKHSDHPYEYGQASGGGGSFIGAGIDQPWSTPLVVAGGGGGAGYDSSEYRVARASGADGVNGNTGWEGRGEVPQGNHNAGGTGGGAGGRGAKGRMSETGQSVASDYGMDAASGWRGSGTSSRSFTAGGLGTEGKEGIEGGFGGGGFLLSTSDEVNGVAGGGGGFSGGGASNPNNGVAPNGGGGGSYIDPVASNPSLTAGINAGMGSVTITRIG